MSSRNIFPRGTQTERWPNVSARTGSSRDRPEYMVHGALYEVAWAWCACSNTKTFCYHQTGKCIRPKKKKNTCVSFILCGISGEFLLVSVSECEWPRGSVPPITVASGRRSHCTTLLQLHDTRTPSLFPSAILQADPYTRFLHIGTSPHDSHDPQSWHSPSMTNILFKPTLLVRVPFSSPLKPHHLTRSFRCFTLTESERDIEIMPGGDHDDVDSPRSGKLPFASAVSWVLQVRWI